jgi:hypothetical protein
MFEIPMDEQIVIFQKGPGNVVDIIFVLGGLRVTRSSRDQKRYEVNDVE